MRKARELAGIGVGEIARAMEVDPDTVGNWERGRTRVRRQTLLAYEQLTGVPAAWMEHGVVDLETPEPEPAAVGTPRRRRSAGPKVNFRWSCPNLGDETRERSAAA